MGTCNLHTVPGLEALLLTCCQEALCRVALLTQRRLKGNCRLSITVCWGDNCRARLYKRASHIAGSPVLVFFRLLPLDEVRICAIHPVYPSHPHCLMFDSQLCSRNFFLSVFSNSFITTFLSALGATMLSSVLMAMFAAVSTSARFLPPRATGGAGSPAILVASEFLPPAGPSI